MKKHIGFQFLYYILISIIYVVTLYGTSLLLHSAEKRIDLGAVMLSTVLFLYILTPMLVVFLMRFSLFKWYVDPFAAAEVPLLLYAMLIFNNMKRSGSFVSSFQNVNDSLSRDSGEGWIFLVLLFVLGLVASFSFARKNGNSISFRIISKLTKKVN